MLGAKLSCRAERDGDGRTLWKVSGSSSGVIYAEMWKEGVATSRVSVDWIVQAV